MTHAKFVQIHTLTTYGINNLNRDDLSRPKTAFIGAALRLRLSSQCVKRAWRISDVMKRVVSGTRTRRFWMNQATALAVDNNVQTVLAHIDPLRQALEGVKLGQKDDDGESSQTGLPSDEQVATEGQAPAQAPIVADKPEAKKAKGKKVDKNAPITTVEGLMGNLFFFSQSEMQFVADALADTLNPEGSTGGKPLTVNEALARLKDLPMSADVAMFGRMVASRKEHSVNGAVQVAHQMTVHKAVVEDDFFAAMDDLSSDDEAGTAHMGANGFGSGTYYGFVNIDIATLLKNLKGDVEMAKAVVAALVEAVTTVSPSAKQNTFACHSLATYAAVEVGNGQNRCWSDAFERPVKGESFAESAIAVAKDWTANTDKVFPSQKCTRAEFNRMTGEGTVDELVACALSAFNA